ncbi:MAG: hypothetical protein OEM29_08780, partial [Thermoplasmata archaeon]|nr:hypothetical protein [Thermoplasmata archaeon]
MMIFAKLADVIVKHHKKILVVWLIILLLSIPAIMKVNDVLAYQESEMVEGDIESLVAQEIIDEQFPVTLANSTLMIVVVGPDMTSHEARDFSLDLGGLIAESDEIAYLEDASSVYSVYEAMIADLAYEVGQMLYETESQVNSTAFLLYGIPAMHLDNWLYVNETYPSLNTTETDGEAYMLTAAALSDLLLVADEATALASRQYYSSFSSAWNSTSTNATLTADPQSRAAYSISIVAPSLIDGLPYSEDQKAIMLGVLSAFDIKSYSNMTLLHSYSLSMIASMAGISDLSFLEDVYALGPEYTLEETATLARHIVSSGTISEYPVSLPEEYMAGFLSPDNSALLIVLSFSKESGYMEDGAKPIVNNVEIVRGLVTEARARHLPS